MNKLIFLFLLLARVCSGQLPDTDLWLFSVKNEKGKLTLLKGENITNRQGYDNQPSFSANDKLIYYSSVREDNQSDIYIYNINNKKSTVFTKTKESEYSPTPIANGSLIACVTVLQDSSQVIQALNFKDGSLSYYPDRRFEDRQLSSFDSVGYFTFLNYDTVLYYKLTQPHSLRARDLKNNADVFIAQNPVRGFKAISRNQFIYGIKDSLKVIYYRYDCVLHKAIKYCEYPSVSEDIIWHKDLGLLKSESATILHYDEKQQKWNLLFDFSVYGIKKITRFIFDSKTKKIVIVNNA